jgi:hypothetical protein
MIAVILALRHNAKALSRTPAPLSGAVRGRRKENYFILSQISASLRLSAFALRI